MYDVHFFGHLALNDIKKFTFSNEDRTLIRRLAAFVKKNDDNSFMSSDSKEPDIEYRGLFTDDTIKHESKPPPTETITFVKKDTQTHRLLYKLLETSDQNEARSKNGYRFNDEIVSGATALRSLIGPSVYKMVHSNLELAIPL